MLGVFGNTPAFDTYFKKRCKSVGITGTFNETALTQLGKFFDSNAVLIEANRITTLNFLTGERDQSRKYTRAKVIDMLFFAEGQTSTIETQSSIRKYRGVVEFED